jgi:peptidyl-prolyl cis-trans isomerase D
MKDSFPMLETFRNAAKGWVAKVFLGLLVLSFAVWGIGDVFSGAAVVFARMSGFGPQDIAKVGETVVSSEQFRRDLNTEIQRISQQTGSTLSLEDARALGLDKQVLDRIINTAVIDSKVSALGLHIGDKSIVDEIAATPDFQNSQGQFDAARFRQALQSNGMDEVTFMSSEKQNRSRRVFSELADQGTSLPRTLTEALSRYRNETRDARYFSFTVNDKDVNPPTDDELKKQYEANPAAYTAPEFRSIAVMKVEPSDIATTLGVTEDEIAAGYERLKGEFFTPETRTILQMSFPSVDKAKVAKARIDKGEDFMKVAMETGAKESDITFTGRTKADFLDTKIADAAFALAEGAVSEPVQGDLTTALLKVASIKPEHQKTLEEVRPELTKRLQLDKAHEEMQSIYDAVEDARANQSKFEDIASKAGIPFVLVPAVSAAGTARDGSDVVLPAKAEVLKTAFDSDVGVENDALTPFDGYLWMEVREVIPSALRPLAEVKSEVTKDFIATKLRTLATDKAKALIAKAGSTTKLDTLAQEMGATIKTATAVKRNDVSEEFDGLAALALFAAPANSLTWSLEGDGKTAKIIEVSKVVTPPFSAMSAETKALSDSTRQGLDGDVLATFVQAGRMSSEVSINDDLWQSIRGNTAQQ